MRQIFSYDKSGNSNSWVVIIWLSMLTKFLTKQLRHFSIFSKTAEAPPDAIFGININFANDTDPRKVNLGIGVYRDDNLQPAVLPVVRKVLQELTEDKTLNMVLH